MLLIHLSMPCHCHSSLGKQDVRHSQPADLSTCTAPNAMQIPIRPHCCNLKSTRWHLILGQPGEPQTTVSQVQLPHDKNPGRLTLPSTIGMMMTAERAIQTRATTGNRSQEVVNSRTRTTTRRDIGLRACRQRKTQGRDQKLVGTARLRIRSLKVQGGRQQHVVCPIMHPKAGHIRRGGSSGE